MLFLLSPCFFTCLCFYLLIVDLLSFQMHLEKERPSEADDRLWRIFCAHHQALVSGVPLTPTLYLVLDVSFETAMSRIKARARPGEADRIAADVCRPCRSR